MADPQDKAEAFDEEETGLDKEHRDYRDPDKRGVNNEDSMRAYSADRMEFERRTMREPGDVSAAFGAVEEEEVETPDEDKVETIRHHKDGTDEKIVR